MKNDNYEITSEGKLLDDFGNLRQKGYARKMILDYSRNDIKARKSRIKEWDYYLIYNDEYAMALTIDDNSYMGLTSVSLIDFVNKREKTTSFIKLFTNGKTKMPSTSINGDVYVIDDKIDIRFNNNGTQRRIDLFVNNFYKKKNLEASIVLDREPDDSIVMATPFKKDKHFYFNQKIVGLIAKGFFRFDEKIYKFDEKNTRAILDWGRGVWTYQNTWFWGGLCKKINGHEIGFNIGYGFGDTTKATENAIFYDGKIHKLNEVKFNIPKNEKGKDDYLKNWIFTSSDERFELRFTPIIDRHADTNIILLRSNQHQVFGFFDGFIVLDDGSKINITHEIGFAEKVFNRW